jgi:germination protein M
VRRVGLVVAAVALVAAIAWGLFWGLPRRYGAPRQATVTAEASALAPGDGRTIRATLFYTTDAGDSLVGVERDVPYGESTAEQARRILVAQLAPVQPPLLQVIPEATRIRTVFVTDKGEAYVDLGAEVSTAHPGGSLDELLTVYAIVNALTVNLPAISAVQILVDGKEVDTLAGHIDLRRPLTRNLSLVKTPAS